MNIMQESEASGISSRNICYYEQVGLLHPDRDPQNDYRTYSEKDIRTLKLIRMLRMLDMPVEEIGDVLQGTVPCPRRPSAGITLCGASPRRASAVCCATRVLPRKR